MRFVNLNAVGAMLFAIFVLAVAGVRAQVTVSVEDQHGKPVKGAYVYVSCEDGTARRGLTNGRGIFKAAGVSLTVAFGKCSALVSGTDFQSQMQRLEQANGDTRIQVIRRVARRKKPTLVTIIPTDASGADIPFGVTIEVSCSTAGVRLIGRGTVSIRPPESCKVTFMHREYESMTINVEIPVTAPAEVLYTVSLRRKK